MDLHRLANTAFLLAWLMLTHLGVIALSVAGKHWPYFQSMEGWSKRLAMVMLSAAIGIGLASTLALVPDVIWDQLLPALALSAIAIVAAGINQIYYYFTQRVHPAVKAVDRIKLAGMIVPANLITPSMHGLDLRQPGGEQDA